jgi:predicted alpha/beta hydrolase family esterase
MKKQIVVIHGGDAFDTYEEYIASLKEAELSLAKLQRKDWKSRLSTDLGEEYDIILPRMPNPQNARYVEWKIWFEKIIPLLDETVAFIGHSLGGIFLTKYLSENVYPKKIKATFLVAAPYNTINENPYVDFNLGSSFDGLQKQGGEIFFYHSKDDVVVPFSSFEQYQKAIPSAHFIAFEDRGHFNQEKFPEIIKDINNVG